MQKKKKIMSSTMKNCPSPTTPPLWRPFYSIRLRVRWTFRKKKLLLHGCPHGLWMPPKDSDIRLCMPVPAAKEFTGKTACIYQIPIDRIKVFNTVIKNINIKLNRYRKKKCIKDQETLIWKYAIPTSYHNLFIDIHR